MPFGLQRIDGPNQSAVLPSRFGQLGLGLFTHRTQQGQKLSIQLADIALVDFHAFSIQLSLDFHQLSMIMLMSPADIRQYIQSIGAVR